MAANQTVKSKAPISVRVKKIKKQNQILVFEKTLQKSKEWIKDVQKEIKFCKVQEAYHILKAVLQALRDQLSIDEGAHFAAQLPLLIRGMYYECWNPPQEIPKALSQEDFIKLVIKNLGPAVDIQVDLKEGIAAVFKVLGQHVSSGEMRDVIYSLSPSLRKFVIKVHKPTFLN